MATRFQICIFILGVSARVQGVVKEGDDPLDWMRDAIPGEPGVDYPIYSGVQETSFNCDSLTFGGYYADPEMECQGYHVCLQDPITPSTLYPVSFLCPNGTVFSQEIFTCDWWYNVDCSASVGLYSGAEAAFGGFGDVNGGGAGQCPASSPGSPDECAGAVSNCWSPGQTDTDCPSNGLCCFDGCADTCVDGPKPEPVARPTPRPTARPALPVAPVIIEQESEILSESVPAPTTKPSGYNYPIPDPSLQLTISRPSTPRPGLPTLYGAPPLGKKKRSVSFNH